MWNSRILTVLQKGATEYRKRLIHQTSIVSENGIPEVLVRAFGEGQWFCGS